MSEAAKIALQLYDDLCRCQKAYIDTVTRAESAFAQGIAAERARVRGVIEAEIQRRDVIGDDPDVLAALVGILRQVDA